MGVCGRGAVEQHPRPQLTLGLGLATDVLVGFVARQRGESQHARPDHEQTLLITRTRQTFVSTV